MPTSQAAIERFLNWRLPPAPHVKAMDAASLHSLIERATGHKYTPATPPRPQQLAGQAFLASQQSGLLFFGMRTGKTKLLLDRISHLRKMGLGRKALIVVPNPVVRPVWVAEAQMHTPHLGVRTVANDPMEFVDALESSADAVVVSWSSLQNIFCSKQHTKKGNHLIEDKELLRMAAEAFSIGMVDEIHGAKDSSSLRFGILELLFSKTQIRTGCTGTPFARNAYALWPQAHLIDYGECLGKSQHFFQEAFGVRKYSHFSKSGTQVVFDENKTDLLAERMQPLALSYTMQECGIVQVEPKVVKLEMTAEQRNHYRQAAQKLVDADGKVQRQNAFHRLRMISSGYVPFTDEEGGNRVAPLAKTPKLEWLADAAVLHSGARIVVFHDYEETGKLITSMLAKHKIKHAWLYGGTRDKPGAVKAFQTGKVDWLVLNNTSGNVGIDLRMADWQVFFECNTSPIVQQQAEARAMGDRAGRSFYMDTLVCSSVEERILGFHREGKDLLEGIIYRAQDWL